MSAVAAIAWVVLPAYLLGALPWGLWVGRLRGVDVRKIGSGNLGATNVYRSLGPAPGVAVLLLDIGKGVAAVLWGRFAPGSEAFPGGAESAAVVAGVVAVLGHVFTVFAGFRGGRGVATTVGAFLALTPAAMGLGLVAFVVVTWWSRRVSAGSLALAAVYPLGILWFEHGDNRSLLLLLALAASLLIVVRHVPNIRRLWAGTEPPFSLRGGGES